MHAKTLFSTLAVSTALIAGAAVQPAFAQSPNVAPAGAAHTLSIAQVHDKLVAAGYSRIQKIEHRQDRYEGYEAKATDREKRLVKLKIDPRTAEVMKTEFKRDKRGDDRRSPAGGQGQDQPRR